MNQTAKPVKLGFWGLTAIVFGMMVGAGIYNIPQNMAAGAGLGAVLISWVITALGMLLLVATFKTLADGRPDLDAGIYQYAQAGWGNFAGFNMAWGYWLCTCFANVAYAIMLNDAFGAFFPCMINSGWSQVIFGSLLIWGMFFVVSCGMHTAKRVNNILAVLKVCVILVIIALLCINVRMGMFSVDFWGTAGINGSLWDQIKSTMLVTLWCFIGIEGAVMMSAWARKPRDVGRAGIFGFFTAWLLYILVSVLCFGIITQQELAGLENPSVAYVLRDSIGDWASYFVIVAVIVSLLGGWVSWTLVCAQVPYKAAAVGIFPRRFMTVNRHSMPTFGLAMSSVIMQFFLLLVVVANNVYLAALSITGMMILPAYLFSGLYLWKTASDSDHHRLISGTGTCRNRLTAAGCVLFCMWMIYAGGLDLLIMTSIFYLFGMGFFIKVRREQNSEAVPTRPLLTKQEIWIFAAIVACAATSALLLATGRWHI